MEERDPASVSSVFGQDPAYHTHLTSEATQASPLPAAGDAGVAPTKTPGGRGEVSPRPPALALRHLPLRLFRHVHLGRADVLDLDGRGAVDVELVAVEAPRAGHVVLVLREHAVLHPELHRALGVRRGRRRVAVASLPALSTATAAAEAQQVDRALLGQLAAVGVIRLGQLL